MSAGQAPSEASAMALERLCCTYWRPIYAFLRSWGHQAHDAQDLTQGFILCLLERNSLATVDPQKGRFRAFLLGALKHYLADRQRREHCQARGGNHQILSLDAEDAEQHYSRLAASGLLPDRAYDQQWAWTTIEHALNQLRDEFARFDQTERFEILKPYLTADPDKGDYTHCADELSSKPGAVAVAIHRLRRRFQILIRREIARTVSSADDLEAELRALFGAG